MDTTATSTAGPTPAADPSHAGPRHGDDGPHDPGSHDPGSHGDHAPDTADPESHLPGSHGDHAHHAADPRTAEIVRRLKSVEGHVRGIGRMVGDGSYCIDVVNQIVAVQRALKKVNGLVLDRHLHTCVTTAMRSRDDGAREEVIAEILGVFEASGKL